MCNFSFLRIAIFCEMCYNILRNKLIRYAIYTYAMLSHTGCKGSTSG